MKTQHPIVDSLEEARLHLEQGKPVGLDLGRLPPHQELETMKMVSELCGSALKPSGNRILWMYPLRRAS